MSLRRGHGKGAGAPRIEVLSPDELPAAQPSITVRAERDGAGRFVRGNTIARMGRVRASKLGKLDVPKGDARFVVLDKWGKRYAAARRRELAELFGGEISHGVAAIIESASLDLVAARFCQALAGEKGDPALLARASQHAQSARQHELAAWELAAREGEARKRVAPGADWWGRLCGTAPAAPAQREPVSSARQDALHDDGEGEDVSDDLDEPLARLRAVQGPHGASDLDEDEGEVIR